MALPLFYDISGRTEGSFRSTFLSYEENLMLGYRMAGVLLMKRNDCLNTEAVNLLLTKIMSAISILRRVYVYIKAKQH